MPCDKQTSFYQPTENKNPCVFSSRHRDIPKTQNGTVVLGTEFLKADKIQEKERFEQSFSFSPPQKKTKNLLHVWFLAFFSGGSGGMLKNLKLTKKIIKSPPTSSFCFPRILPHGSTFDTGVASSRATESDMPPRREMNGNVAAETPVEGGQEFTAPKNRRKTFLGGGFKYLLFSPLFGEDFQFD